MATRGEFEQVKAYARIDGALVGVLWILSFACFIGEFSCPMLGFASMLIGVSSLVVAAIRLYGFRNNVLDGIISFRRAYVYSMLTYFYAALLMAAAQFAYFHFMDDGYLISRYTEIMQTGEFKQMMAAGGLKTEDMKIAMDNLSRLRPIDIALQFLTLNIIMGAVISLPIAMIMKTSIKRKYK